MLSNKNGMPHTFVINDDSIVNEYGYRVMNSGLDTSQFMRNPVVLFMHRRGDQGNEVIGKVTDIRQSGAQMLADVEFDVEDEFAKKISGKVERGFVRMASIYADVKETSISPEDILPGQTFETVTASKLVELSIVDIGGNDNAIKLSRQGEPIQLKKINSTSMDLKSIALSLGMDANSTEEAILKEAKKIQQAKEAAEKRLKTLETEHAKLRKAEAEQLVAKAVKLGLVNEGLKDNQIKAFESDFDGQKAIFSKLIGDAETEAQKDGKQEAVRTVVLGAGKKPNGTTEESFDYLQKHDPVKLGKIREEQPQEYAKLAKAYANGVRHKDS